MFKLKIETENAAFGDNDTDARLHELATLLRKIAVKLERGESSGVIFDGNGNHVGEFGTDDETDDETDDDSNIREHHAICGCPECDHRRAIASKPR